MFTVDSNITDLKIQERNLFKVLFSMNIHQVATPELSVDDARSYIFFCREGSGRVMAYIGLYFTHTDRKLYYTYSSNPFPEGEMADVEAEARAFAEDMGAMLDEIDIAKMSSEERNRWINEQDIFSTKKKAEEKPVEQPAVAEPAATAVQAPVQPAPAAVQPAAAAPSAPPAQPAPQVQPAAPPVQPQMQTPPSPQEAVQPPVAAPPVQATPRPKKRPAAPAPSAEPASERTPAQGHAIEDVLDEALKAGIVKAPKKQLSNDIRSATGKVSRDKEALARLLASF